MYKRNAKGLIQKLSFMAIDMIAPSDADWKKEQLKMPPAGSVDSAGGVF